MVGAARVVICCAGGMAAFLLTVGGFVAVGRLPGPADGLSRLARAEQERISGPVRAFLERLEKKLRASGVSLSAWRYLGICGACVCLGLVLAILATRSLTAGVVVGAVAGCVPGRWLGARRLALLRNVGQQLEAALLGMADSLSAGQSLAQAMEGAAQQGEPPLAGEFGAVLREYEAGMPLLRALGRMRDRLPCEEVNYLVQAFDIHTRGGGNVVEVLGHLADTLRERRILRGELQAKTAEARLSAWIVALTPVLFAGYLAASQPEALALVLTDELGRMAVAGGIVLWLLGVLTVSRLVRLDDRL